MATSATAIAGPLSDGPKSPLELQIVQGPSSQDKIDITLKIINHSDQPIVIERGIEIDQTAELKWNAVTSIQAVAGCTEYDLNYAWHAPVRIEADTTLTVSPWHGWTCGDGRQCPESCMKNAQVGPGFYRFVVITAEGKRLPSKSFAVPSR